MYFFSKMFQVSQASMLGLSLESYSGRLPKWGSMLSGVVYEQQMSAPRTGANAGFVWPTVTAHQQNTRYQQGGTPLTVAVQNWPTIKANAERVSRGWLLTTHPIPALEQACELAEGQLPREYEDVSELSPAAARIWPTPSARDWKDGRASDATLERNARPLNEQVVAITDGPAHLSPEWVEALQGFPPGWTDISGPQAPVNRSTTGSQRASQAA